MTMNQTDADPAPPPDTEWLEPLLALLATPTRIVRGRPAEPLTVTTTDGSPPPRAAGPHVCVWVGDDLGVEFLVDDVDDVRACLESALRDLVSLGMGDLEGLRGLRAALDADDIEVIDDGEATT